MPVLISLCPTISVTPGATSKRMNEDINSTNYFLEQQNCELLSVNVTLDEGKLYCPSVWDTLLCWPPTIAGTTANQSCPKKHLGYDPRRLAFRECWSNGSWYIHPESHKDWSNYTTCIDHDDLEFRSFINNLFVIGYSVSLAALVISLIIFYTFRSLKCTRIRIHIQLFISFALNNLMWVIWYKEVVPNPYVIGENTVWCQLLHIMVQYSMLANYMWMFCEGLHLHIALVVVFVRDEVAMKWFFALGWGAPFLFVSIYSAVRKLGTRDTLICWMNDSHTTWILTAPVLISLIASLVFLINVLRVILTIMHPNSANPAPMGVRRAARAALILVPLFGLQHILIPFRPDVYEPYEHLYQYVTVIIVSLQGLCVSCLFCFANQDVHQAVRVFLHRRMHRSRWNNYQYTGAADSAAVYVVNGTSQSNMAMFSLKRKSTSTIKV